MEGRGNLETGFGPMLATFEVEKPSFSEKSEPLVKLPTIYVKPRAAEGYCCKEQDEGNETDDGVKREKESEDWSPSAVSCLLDMWGNQYQTANNSKLSMANWGEIAEEVSGRYGQSKKAKDAAQCKAKVKALKRRYNRERMAKRFPPSEPCSWEWYDVMDVILEGTPHFAEAGGGGSVSSPASKHEGEHMGAEDAKSHLRVKLPKEDDNPRHNAASKASSKLRVTKLFPKESSSATITPRSESSYCLKQKRKPAAACEKYRQDPDHRTPRALVTALLRIACKPSSSKRRVKSSSSSGRYLQEPNTVSALMAFSAMIQQLERSQIAMMERVLNEQSVVLSDFVKTLKYNNQVREASAVGLVVRFLLSVLLIGLLLLGTPKPVTEWVLRLQATDWFQKAQEVCGGPQLAWIACFAVAAATQLAWLPFKRRQG